MQHPLIVSYYTPGTTYEDDAMVLAEDIRRLGLAARIEPRAARGFRSSSSRARRSCISRKAGVPKPNRAAPYGRNSGWTTSPSGGATRRSARRPSCSTNSSAATSGSHKPNRAPALIHVAAASA
jgi:hypothetical protein